MCAGYKKEYILHNYHLSIYILHVYLPTQWTVMVRDHKNCSLSANLQLKSLTKVYVRLICILMCCNMYVYVGILILIVNFFSKRTVYIIRIRHDAVLTCLITLIYVLYLHVYIAFVRMKTYATRTESELLYYSALGANGV